MNGQLDMAYLFQRSRNLAGSIHGYNVNQLRGLGATNDVIESNSIPTGVSNKTLAMFRQEIDHNNQEMIDMLTSHMAAILNPMLRTINDSYQQMNNILNRIGNVLAIPRNQTSQTMVPNVHDQLVYQPVPEIRPIDKIQPVPRVQSLVMENRNRSADEVIQNVQQNQMLGQNLAHNSQQINLLVEQALNRHEFVVGYANQPYFVFAFLDYVLQKELPWGHKVPKFSKFSGKLGKSTVEHVVRYQIEWGDLITNEYLKMKHFPISLTKNTFLWFTTLALNSIFT